MAKTQAESNLDDPQEMFAWMFAAGVPDPRNGVQGRNYGNQPLIPPKCYGALSQMLYDMGARFHPELQKVWVGAKSGPDSNFVALGTVDVKPEEVMGTIAAMTADQYPEMAAKIAAVTPETQKQVGDEVTQKLLDNLARLRELSEQVKEGTKEAPTE